MGCDTQHTEYGEISASFSQNTLVNLCLDKIGIQTGPFGSQLHNEDYVLTGTPIITVEHLGDNRIIYQNMPLVSNEDKVRLSKYCIKEGDIVFSRVGSVDRRALVRQEEDGWLFSGRCLRVRVDKTKIDPVYLSYFFGLDGFKNHIKSIAVGATMPSINTKILSNLPIYYPNLETQYEIGQVLLKLDNKIELNRQMNETLEAMARAIFKSWFVDFDPVHAKAEGLDTGLPEEIADLFPDSFEEKELGEVPKGWKVKPFADTIDVIGGGTPKTSVTEYWNGEIPWFSVVDAPNAFDVWVVDTEKKITQLGVENSSTKILPTGTTIISARGTVGRVALVGVPMAMNQSCYGFRGKNENEGFFTYFSTLALVSDLRQNSHGSVFSTITKDTLKGVTIVLPPSHIIQSFEKKVAPILRRIRENAFESRILAELRDALLPKLISGELRIVGKENT